MKLREVQEKKSNEISKLNAEIQSLRKQNSILKEENNSFSRQVIEQQNQIRLLKDAIDNLPKPENKPSQMKPSFIKEVIENKDSVILSLKL